MEWLSVVYVARCRPRLLSLAISAVSSCLAYAIIRILRLSLLRIILFLGRNSHSLASSRSFIRLFTYRMQEFADATRRWWFECCFNHRRRLFPKREVHKADYCLIVIRVPREHGRRLIIPWIYESEESIEYYVNGGKVRGDGINRINNDDRRRHRDSLWLCCFTFDSIAWQCYAWLITLLLVSFHLRLYERQRYYWISCENSRQTEE